MDKLEDFVKYLVRNAYIVVALEGSPLLSSGKKAFSLLRENFVQAAALNYFGDFVLFLGKVFVVLISGFVTFCIVGVSTDLNLMSPELLMIFICRKLTICTTSWFLSCLA
jgi:hypothetical protein